MQTLPRLANPHKRTDWLKTCQILGLMRSALWRGGGPESEESFQEGACGWAEWESPNLPLLQVMRWGTAQLLAHPWNNRALLTLAVVRKEQEHQNEILSMERGNCLLLALQILGCTMHQEAKLALTAHDWHTLGWPVLDPGAAAPREAPEHLLSSGHSRSWTAWPHTWGATATDSTLSFWKTATPGAWWIPAGLLHLQLEQEKSIMVQHLWDVSFFGEDSMKLLGKCFDAQVKQRKSLNKSSQQIQTDLGRVRTSSKFTSIWRNLICEWYTNIARSGRCQLLPKTWSLGMDK